MSVDVLLPDQLDFAKYARLQKDSFAELLESSGVSDSFITPEFFRWKYGPPAGQGRVAIVSDGGEMVAANAMIPVLISNGKTSVLAWQSCDTATLPSHRGKGHFLKCVQALEKTLGPGEILFGFPNQNSKRGFTKLGWKEKGIIPLMVRPIVLPLPATGHEIRSVDLFDSSCNHLAQKSISGGAPMAIRDAAYLNWRYPHHPVHSYSSFIYRTGDRTEGILVLREASVSGRRMVLVMDLWATTPRIERRLLHQASRWGRERGLRFLCMLSNCMSPLRALLAGVIHVPSRLLPKQQILMGMDTGGPAHAIMQAEWRVQTGDWDGF